MWGSVCWHVYIQQPYPSCRSKLQSLKYSTLASVTSINQLKVTVVMSQYHQNRGCNHAASECFSCVGTTTQPLLHSRSPSAQCGDRSYFKLADAMKGLSRPSTGECPGDKLSIDNATEIKESRLVDPQPTKQTVTKSWLINSIIGGLVCLTPYVSVL